MDSIASLPAHPLIVHASVILIPVAAISVLLATVWPEFQRRAGRWPLGATTVAILLQVLTDESGRSLQDALGTDPAIERHAELAHQLGNWLFFLFLASAVATWLWRRQRSRAVPRALTACVALLAVVASVGTLQQVVRVGHSGAQAAWEEPAEH
ncbi:DUF2231 domain-containing protein [Kineosporia babensis]|uniref:DUF2231 domain-containing protein n=1 Tax=Kineosporia babensis TaxID=499548 RepID=A0A9X1SZB0_9ACTN|nr:DUF2231 domain-containing protein [Kineosporia babensis]MCD5311818.1 hypothetical protein [Kineosporia babensis]